jgi:hypothetical protein
MLRGRDPARGQALAAHPDDDLLDLLPADRPDLPVPDGRVHVGAEHRLVGHVAALRADPLAEPCLRLSAEDCLPRVRVDEDMRLLVVLNLEQEVLGLFKVVAE